MYIAVIIEKFSLLKVPELTISNFHHDKQILIYLSTAVFGLIL